MDIVKLERDIDLSLHLLDIKYDKNISINQKIPPPRRSRNPPIAQNPFSVLSNGCALLPPGKNEFTLKLILDEAKESKDFKKILEEMNTKMDQIAKDVNELKKDRITLKLLKDTLNNIIYDENEYDFEELKDEEEHHVVDHTDHTKIRELESQLHDYNKHRKEVINQLEECKKHRNEVEIKINEIITAHLNMNISEVENKTGPEKLDTILNRITDQVDECLKLLGVKYNNKDSLMEKLKKLVKACENLILVGPVQERLWYCLTYLDSSSKSLKSFTSNFNENMDKLL
ncbi:21909_t:CDS:2 [Dentiscutata erythropus]|uniref:21909_t:CDS:1 n=1 Tax=Dentiscutata erythropus TaxID=1348616 RepID=A0A9N8VWI5_9GLOM|nr:21909_t:CDS:2 [Dentiscutata erythropus]